MERAVVLDELKDVFQLLFGDIALKGDFQAQVAQLRVQVRQLLLIVKQSGHIDDGSQPLQIAQEREGVHTVLEHGGLEANRDVPVIVANPGIILIILFANQTGAGVPGWGGHRQF